MLVEVWSLFYVRFLSSVYMELDPYTFTLNALTASLFQKLLLYREPHPHQQKQYDNLATFRDCTIDIARQATDLACGPYPN